MRYLNQGIIEGLLASEPETRSIADAVIRTEFVIECPERDRKGELIDTDYIVVTAYGEDNAEIVKAWRKGDVVRAIGRIECKIYDDRIDCHIRANRIERMMEGTR